MIYLNAKILKRNEMITGRGYKDDMLADKY